jgi:TorA maturation chaperone TorD
MTSGTPTALDGAQLDEALARSALYEVLALGFGPPTATVSARLAAPGSATGLIGAATAVHPDLPPLIARLTAADARPDTLAAAHVRLFGHTAQGEVPLLETEYGADGLFLHPQQLADIAGFYRAVGLVVAADAGERPDHVRCECELLMFLARKEAVAIERNDVEEIQATRTLGRLFLRDHLGRFVPALAARLTRLDPAGFYGALAAVAGRFVEIECVRAGVPAGPPALRLRLPVDDGVPMACGSCPLGSGEAGEDDGD